MGSNEIRWAIADALSAALPRCGECKHWMKSRECPREHNVNGMSRGPSCGAAVCDKFVAKDEATAAMLAERWKPAAEYLKSKTV